MTSITNVHIGLDVYHLSIGKWTGTEIYRLELVSVCPCIAQVIHKNGQYHIIEPAYSVDVSKQTAVFFLSVAEKKEENSYTVQNDGTEIKFTHGPVTITFVKDQKRSPTKPT